MSEDSGFFGRLFNLSDLVQSFSASNSSARRRNFFFSNVPPLTDVMETTHSQSAASPFITEMLKAYPVSDKNSNKVELPASILNEINARKLLDTRQRDRPMIFELSVADPETDDVIAETHVGVEKFTAPTGTIGLPYKTALSLTKERGVAWLKRNPYVFVQYMELANTPETMMFVQPRGKGFFLEDDKAVQLDIKTLLEHSLKDHLVLTEGDWIPLFYQGHRFTLVVKKLEPNAVIDVLNTDLTVELLPSEEHEEDVKAREEAKERLKTFLDLRELRYKEKAVELENEAEPEKTEKAATLVRVKLPKGGTAQRRFLDSSNIISLFDFVEVELYKAEFTPLTLPNINFEKDYVFNLVFSLPGRKKQTIKTNDKTYSSLSLSELKQKLDVKNNAITFNIETLKDSNDLTEDNDNNNNNNNNTSVKKQKEQTESEMLAYDNDWLKLADRLEANLEKEDSDQNGQNSITAELLPNSEVERIKGKVLACGLNEEDASKIARLYGKQVKVIESMGYEEEQFEKAVKLLKAKKGDLESVLNNLMG